MGSPNRTWIAVAVVALLAVAGCTSDTDWAADRPAAGNTTPTTTPPEWLFVVQSDGDTTFDPASGRLALPAGSVQAFTDRPHRDTRATSPQSFVDLWQANGPDSFRADPPNAVLTYWDTVDGVEVPRTVVCEIVGDVDYAAADGQLSMGLRVLDPKGATLPTTMRRASLFVDDVAGPICLPEPADESNVEYFNMMNFNEGFVLQVEDVPGSNDHQVWLECPERESPSIPSSSFDVRLATPDRATVVSCYSDEKITFTAADLGTLTYCSSSGSCRLEVLAVNSETEMTYSTTSVEVMVTANSTIAPELEPATIPLCNQGDMTYLTGPRLSLES